MMSSGILIKDSHDVNVMGNNIEGYETGITFERSSGIVKENVIIATQFGQFPLLHKASPSDLEAITSELRDNPGKPAEKLLRNSRLGRWLVEQKFTDWAALAIAIAAYAKN